MDDEWTDPRNDLVEGACVWCKKTHDEAAEGVQLRPIESTYEADHGTGAHELICDPCLRQLRAYKRTKRYIFAVSDEYPEEFALAVFEAVGDAIQEVCDERGVDHNPGEPVKINASNDYTLIDSE